MKPYTTKLRCFYFWRPETESAGDFTHSLPGSCAIKFNMAGNVQFLDLTPSAEAEIRHVFGQPWSQGLRGETVTKTLVKFILSFQNFGKKIACAVRHNRIAITDLNNMDRARQPND